MNIEERLSNVQVAADKAGAIPIRVRIEFWASEYLDVLMRVAEEDPEAFVADGARVPPWIVSPGDSFCGRHMRQICGSIAKKLPKSYSVKIEGTCITLASR